MNALSDIAEASPVGLRDVQTAEALSAFLEDDCAAAIWRHPVVSGFQAWIDALPVDRLPNARVVLKPGNVRRAVDDICIASGVPGGPERDRFAENVAALSDIFAKLTEASYLRLRLSVVTSNSCRKFHRDAVAARMVCTYRGTGTQYGTSQNGLDPARIFTAPTGSPVLLRGTLWPERPATGLVHRSPPIEGTGETRLVLVLDCLTEHEEEF
ncbi:MAG: DUF1826 domain-containing protein [Pseudomonadota bacterium]